jgi:mRNA interferase YafQ
LKARTPISGGQFRRDVKLAQRRGKDMSKLREMISLLVQGEPLPPATRTIPSPVNGNTFVTATWNPIGS